MSWHRDGGWMWRVGSGYKEGGFRELEIVQIFNTSYIINDW